MPFTISHAGFVMPLRRRLAPHILCGLIVGSVVPDFGYFIRAFELASFAHSVLGALCVSVPIGFCLYSICTTCFSRFASILPSPHSDFLETWEIGQSRIGDRWLAVTIAIFVGALSHNFVDSFTHESGLAVSVFPILGDVITSIRGEPLHLYRILQYAGSLIGIGMLMSAYGFGLRRYCLSSQQSLWQDRRRWLALLVLLILTIVVATLMNAEVVPREISFYALRVFGFKFLITWIPLFGLGFLGLAIFRNSPRQNLL